MEALRTLERVVESTSLKWIFVGGKGGVGKTTTSAALGLQLAKRKEQVLIISTDPAHNLSDAFDQKFGSTPTQVNEMPNLFAMEISPKFDAETIHIPEALALETDQATKDFITELVTSIPGIDEAMSFAELMKAVQTMNFSVIVFDTAPTGHTLRLLNFPSLLDRGLSRIVDLKQRFGSLFTQMSAMFGQPEGEGMYNSAFGRIEAMKSVIEQVNTQIQDPVLSIQARTTFIAVCIPEFLSLYETERLIQELCKNRIDIQNIIVNQVLYPQDRTPYSECRMCIARKKMQDKYISQIEEMYDDFNIGKTHAVHTPLLEEEVRGVQKLMYFGTLLLSRR